MFLNANCSVTRESGLQKSLPYILTAVPASLHMAWETKAALLLTFCNLWQNFHLFRIPRSHIVSLLINCLHFKMLQEYGELYSKVYLSFLASNLHFSKTSLLIKRNLDHI